MKRLIVPLIVLIVTLACQSVFPSAPKAEYGVAVMWTDRMQTEHGRIWIDPVVEVWELEFDKYSLPPAPLTGDQISLGFAGEPRGNIAVVVLYFACGENGESTTCGFAAQIDDAGTITDVDVNIVTDQLTVNQSNTGMFTQDGNFKSVEIPLECVTHDELSSDGVMHLSTSVCRTDDTYPLPGLAPQYEEPKPTT